MSKRALGKGLGHLLSSPAPAEEQSPSVPVTPGVRKLLHGTPEPASEPTPRAVPDVRSIAPRDYTAFDEGLSAASRLMMVVGDLLLVMMTCLYVFNKPRPLQFFEGVLCVATILTGALLTCLAITSAYRSGR